MKLDDFHRKNHQNTSDFLWQPIACKQLKYFMRTYEPVLRHNKGNHKRTHSSESFLQMTQILSCNTSSPILPHAGFEPSVTSPHYTWRTWWPREVRQSLPLLCEVCGRLHPGSPRWQTEDHPCQLLRCAPAQYWRMSLGCPAPVTSIQHTPS